MSQTPRPDKTKYYLEIAAAVARRSTCLRRQYGAIIVAEDAIVATGYNGAARGFANCCDTGECARARLGIPHGERYELCQAVHAEANAMLSGNRADMRGATLYLAGYENGKRLEAPEPCPMCRRMIRNAQIARVIAAAGEEEKNDADEMD